MDILQLIDRLEELVDRGWRLPFTEKVAVEEEVFLNIVDQMRITIPQEVKQAKEVDLERDRYIAQAHEDARQIRAQAREDAAKLLDEHEIKRRAEAQAAEIIKRAQRDAARMAQGADSYADAQLQALAETVEQLRRQVENGRATIAARRPKAQAVEETELKGAPAPGAGAQAELDRQGD